MLRFIVPSARDAAGSLSLARNLKWGIPSGPLKNMMIRGSNEETFNISIRKFLKSLASIRSVPSNRRWNQAIADGAITGTESFPATVTLEVAGLELNVKFDEANKLA